MKTKHIVWTLIVLAATLGVIGYFSMREADHSHGDELAEVYTCPMHPSVRSDRPGACPVCGMALVRKSDGGVPEIDSEILGAISLSPTQRVVANISTVPVMKGTIVAEINSVGLVTEAEPGKATVAARFRGRIDKLYADVTGEQVTKDEPLFELYSPDLISAQREFLLALSHAGSGNSLVTTSSMQEQLLAAARELLIMHYGLTTEQVLELEQSREVRSTVLFKAPISGTVLEKRVVEGEYVEEGMPLYRLADLTRVWVMLDVYESDLGMIRNGQEVVITSEAYPGEEFRGRVTFTDPVLEAATRTVKVRTEFDNRDGRLKPNMYTSARIGRTIEDVLVVPVHSIVSTGRTDVVWVEVGENVFEPRAVMIGARNADIAQVLSGLREGEMIAATGGYLLDSESALRLPSASDPHAGHGTEQAGQAEPATGANGEIAIHVEGGYFPRVIHLRKGETARLNFLRAESASCTEEVVIKELGVRARLPEGEHVVVEVTPEKAGEFVFSCGMNMIHGKIIVHE